MILENSRILFQFFEFALHHAMHFCTLDNLISVFLSFTHSLLRVGYVLPVCKIFGFIKFKCYLKNGDVLCNRFFGYVT